MRSFKVVAIVASLFSCSALVAAQLQTIQQAVNSFSPTAGHSHGSSNFQELVGRHGISFEDNKNYTLFVPYNYAISSDSNVISKDLLNYHISSQAIPPQSTPGQVLANTLLIGTGANNNVTDLPAGLAQRLIVNYTSNGNITVLSYGQDNTTSSDFVMTCSNGYIYFIVSALKLPLAPSNAFNSNQNVGGLNDMGNALAAISRNGRSGSALLNNATGITFFAVNNAAYSNAQAQENSNNSRITNTTVLFTVQTVAGGVVAYTDYLSTNAALVNAAGETLNVTVVNGVYYVNGVQVIYANIPVSNGVMHVMSRLFDDKSNSTRNKNGTVPTGSNTTDTNNNGGNSSSAASCLYASSSMAALSAAFSAGALFLVFGL